MSQHDIELTVNGEAISARVKSRTNLVDFLRQDLGLTGTHVGCEQGFCGACTIEVDGQMVRACLMLAVQVDGSTINTIEGFSQSGRTATLQRAFVEHNALQCGFCTSGMIATALDYIETDGRPDRQAIRMYLSGNYCRCTGYQAIVDAIADVTAQPLSSTREQDQNHEQ